LRSVGDEPPLLVNQAHHPFQQTIDREDEGANLARHVRVAQRGRLASPIIGSSSTRRMRIRLALVSAAGSTVATCSPSLDDVE
jgi:hypothetical protein